MKKEVKSSNYPQKWMLVKMTGQMADSEITGENMAWQEYYLLESSGKFVKYRNQNGKKSKGMGTYKIVEENDGNYLELVYNTHNPIIGSCSIDQKEVLWFQEENKLLGTWQACDGPGLEYKRVK
ncbi:hypothetical protein [Maribacter sp. 2210JD10-5]|uniref:hypothetical protein n=1 Tax=Maribacter sp. 2210JD10-5 TaxID=3386272 RepID=UPI0039BC9988